MTGLGGAIQGGALGRIYLSGGGIITSAPFVAMFDAYGTRLWSHHYIPSYANNNQPMIPDSLYGIAILAVDGSQAIYIVSHQGTGLVTIKYDQPKVVNQVRVGTLAVIEPATGMATASFTLQLDAPATRDITITYQTVNGTALSGIDYQSISGVLIIPEGSQEGTIHVPVMSDATKENIEFFAIRLTETSPGVLIIDPLAFGYIMDASPYIMYVPIAMRFAITLEFDDPGP